MSPFVARFFFISQQTFVDLQVLLKMCSRYDLKNSSRSLQDDFKTPWKTKNCYDGDFFKTSEKNILRKSSRYVFKTFLQDVFKICLTYLNLYLTNCYLKNVYLANLKRIQDKSTMH